MFRNRSVQLICGLVLTGAFATAQNADLSVIHGIPGLPKAVDVFANGNKLFSFEYGESKGPLSLPAGTYNIEVKLDGRTVLQARPTVEADKNYTAIAHLKEKEGIQLSFFVNDTSAVKRGESRIDVHHTAMAPSVDVYVRRASLFSRSVRLIRGLTNPKNAAADVRSASYYVWLTPANSSRRAFGPARLTLRPDTFYGVYAIGELGKRSFRLFVQTINLGKTPELVGLVRGRACGGKIDISTESPEFGKNFDVTLADATKNGFGLFHIGTSDSRFLIIPLPLRLDILGLRGCSLYQNTPIVRPIRTNGMGAASQTLQIPASMASSFREMHFQYSFLASDSNRFGLLLTDYASVERK